MPQKTASPTFEQIIQRERGTIMRRRRHPRLSQIAQLSPTRVAKRLLDRPG